MSAPGAAEGSLACVTGRFQPVHADHLRLFRIALRDRGALVVGVTNPDPGARARDPSSDHRHRDDANPFTYYERCGLLAAALASDEGVGAEAAAGVRIVPFDLARPEHWTGYVPAHAVQYVGRNGPWEREKARRLAAGGYRVVEVDPGAGARRSATAIREAIRSGGAWEELVPAATVEPLRALLAGPPRGGRRPVSGPPPADDRLPAVLVILDGLGDRPVPELGSRTPAEAARTPVLDELARRGASGWHVPLGWGRAPSSETSHWALLGCSGQPFPGRAVLEGLGAGLDVPYGVATLHGALRTSRPDGGVVRVTGRPGPGDADDAAALLWSLAPAAAAHGVAIHPVGRRGECLLLLARHASGDVSDSDPFFEHLHPWLAPVATAPEGEALAAELTAFLRDARAALRASAVNAGRVRGGRPALDLLTTKWAGVRRPLPSFDELAGVPGAAVTSSGLYRGLATALGLARADVPSQDDLAAEMAARLAAATALLGAGAAFVHVHTKATDEAGHTKLPFAKRDALEAIDAGLEPLLDLAGRAVVAVTGDHATPSTSGVMHTGDPTPFTIAGGAVRPDAVDAFGEAPARSGDLGVLAAADVLPLLFSAANRPAFLGHRTSALPTWALADAPAPFPLGD